MQFIRPVQNTSEKHTQSNFSQHLYAPANVEEILKKSCYDCHSNNTYYPWYVNIQPIGWLMASHIKDGKAELNFDEFGNYPSRRQFSKLKAIAGSVRDATMPIKSYTWMHSNSKLLPENKALIIEWTLKTKDSIEAKNSLNK